MEFPSFDPENVIDDSVLPVGVYNFSISNTQHKVSSNHNDMMATESVVDVGEHAGAKVEDLFVFGLPSAFGEKKLNAMSVVLRKDDKSLNGDDEKGIHPGFAYTSNVESWEQFCSQFVQSPPLRFLGQVTHELTVKEAGGDKWENKVSQARFNEVKGAGGSAFVKLNVKVVNVPNALAEIKVVPKIAVARDAQKRESFPGTAGGDGAFAPAAAPAPSAAPAATKDPKSPF